MFFIMDFMCKVSSILYTKIKLRYLCTLAIGIHLRLSCKLQCLSKMCSALQCSTKFNSFMPKRRSGLVLPALPRSPADHCHDIFQMWANVPSIAVFREG